MRPLRDMDTIQIEITNQCTRRCSNCTRLVGHHRHPYFMDYGFFKSAVDSLIGYVNQSKNHPLLIGIMGGEPLLHPQFEQFSLYLHEKVHPKNCGLWTCFPKSESKYAELITNVYGNVFLNDHSRADVLHNPILVTGESLGLDVFERKYYYHHCWVQNYWSAAINPDGAYFCEVAAALRHTFGTYIADKSNIGWDMDKDWWKRTPQDFGNQLQLCEFCGCSFPLLKRASTSNIDDVSKDMFNKLDLIASPRLNKCQIYDKGLVLDTRQSATYKNEEYRRKIADKYNMFLMSNQFGFQTPRMKVIGR